MGKKNSPPDSDEFVRELRGISGVGPEYAERLAKIYKTREKLRKAGDDIKLMLPDHVAKKVMSHLRK